MAKKLEKGSIWEQADADVDGVVTDEEIAKTLVAAKNNAIELLLGIFYF